MGAKCCRSQPSDAGLLRVKQQDLMMDNDEVKIMRVKDRTMAPKNKKTKNEDMFDGFL